MIPKPGEILALVGEHVTFEDRNLGTMLAVRDWHGNGPWLFRLHYADWISTRPATRADLALLGVGHWLAEE